MYLKSYSEFYRMLGETMHHYTAYWYFTSGNTKNQTHQIPQSLSAHASRAESSIHRMFRDIVVDRKNNSLSEADYKRFIECYKLIIDNPCILAPKIKQDKDILQAVRELN